MGVQFSRREVLAAACATAALAPLGARAERKTSLTAGAVQFGTGQWLFDAIANNKLDAAEGFTLSQRLLASNSAADIALLGRQADIVIADWFWVMRQRNLGGDYLFMPFTAALGGVIVPEGSPLKEISDLKGKEIGVAGGPTDKSWILLRAYGIKHGAGDLASTAKPVFGAPPLLNEQAAAGPLGRAVELLALRGKARSQGLAAADRGFRYHALFRHRSGTAAGGLRVRGEPGPGRAGPDAGLCQGGAESAAHPA